jgi:DNA modification methylase
VTSYEYADLHQLPLLWLGHLDELTAFRKKFIGSSFKERTEKIDLKSDLANETIHRLKNKKAKEVETYFADMLEAFQEMKRVLKVGGKICMVIGNTKFQEVEILNAEVFAEQLESIGFKIYDVICREIPSKMLPSTRDKETGRFAKTANTDILAYPKEYILIAEKI